MNKKKEDCRSRQSGGEHINYLSGAQLAESIGNSDNTVRHSKMDKELKVLLGKDFTVRHCFAKMTSGGGAT